MGSKLLFQINCKINAVNFLIFPTYFVSRDAHLNYQKVLGFHKNLYVGSVATIKCDCAQAHFKLRWSTCLDMSI